METQIPLWLLQTLFTGRDPGDGDEGDDDNEGDDPANDDQEGQDQGAEDGDDGEDGEDGEDDLAELKKALAEERKLRRKAEREARKATKSKGNDEEKKTLEELQTHLAEEQTKTQRLAARLLAGAQRDAIVAEATRQNFIDPTDALVEDVLRNIEVDQDPDDPSDIEVDEDSVKKAVTKLAGRKKHLIGEPGKGPVSGGRFSRKTGTKDDGKASEDKLKDEYPSLR